ncbi:DUF2269 family protein [bacterium LRH843]|nr:DUF2269 family protein [bacterium LRH843]
MDYLLYRFVLYLHIISAIITVGPFFLLLSTVKKLRLARKEEINPYLDTFRFAVWLAKHAGHVLSITGILLVIYGPWTWRTPWIIVTLIILLCSLFFLARAFSPTLRKFDDEDHNREELTAKLTRSVWIYISLLMVILWFMVGKPTLW